MTDNIKEAITKLLDDGAIELVDYFNPATGQEGKVTKVKREKIDQLLSLFERYARSERIEGEGYGRTQVLSALKDWADDVEVIYNRLLEDELEKVHNLQNSPVAPEESKGDA